MAGPSLHQGGRRNRWSSGGRWRETRMERRAPLKAVAMGLAGLTLLWPGIAASARAQYTFSPFPQSGASDGERLRREQEERDRCAREQQRELERQSERQRQEREAQDRRRQEEERRRQEQERQD